MIKFRPLYILLVLALVLTSCSDDVTESNVTVKFELKYGDQTLEGFQDVDYPEGYKVFFSKYSMFLSNITLQSAEGDVLLSEVEWLDLLDGQQEHTRAYASIPARAYEEISFQIGVPETVNETVPADYPSSSPLSNAGEHWEGWSSYIFHKIEGKMDIDGDNVPETGIALHIGSDQAFRQVSIATPIALDQEQETITIEFDLRDILLLDTGKYYDFVATPQVHHQGVLPKVLPILDSTAEKVSVN